MASNLETKYHEELEAENLAKSREIKVLQQ